jgi:hypothetical protein
VILPLAKVLVLAAQCGAISVSQLIALPGQLRQESGYDTLAVNDNTLGVSFHPESEQQAIAYVLAHPGDSIDAGLLQINNEANWARLGLDAHNVFDAQTNVCAGLQVLREGLSVFNTGRVTPRGLAYANRVLTVVADPNSPRTRSTAVPPRGEGSSPQGSGADTSVADDTTAPDTSLGYATFPDNQGSN